MGATSLTSVFAFAIFADDYPVERARRTVFEGRGNAAKNFGGANVGVLLEGLADCEAQAPERNVVGHVYA